MLDIREIQNEILESIEGFLVIDVDERIVFMCKKLLKMIGIDDFNKVKGLQLRDVIASNQTWRVLKTGERQIGVTYLVHGYTIVSNSFPIYKDGTLIGALEYDVFEDAALLKGFLDTMSSQKGLEHFGTALARRRREKYTIDSIKGSSSETKALKKEILQSSRSSSTVIINGETGTGKELIAQAIHMAGSRSIFEFVVVNCASIPQELFESELFGYEEGSFTGARKGGKQGLIALADKGTLFLDEMEALPLPMQAKLLRFLEDREVRKVGGEKSAWVDVRIICATNADLAELVRKGQFREDLYYRLNVINLTAGALRTRKSDIPELVNHFIEELNTLIGKNISVDRIKGVEDDALSLLMEYDWPGNIRELKNFIERAMNRCTGNILRKEDFKELARQTAHGSDISAKWRMRGYLTLKEMKHLMEQEAIASLISERGLSVTAAARSLGISRQMLHKKLRAYGIGLPSRDGEGEES
jgi:transcriptional regulator with PAS, ATPase and Fis domain